MATKPTDDDGWGDAADSGDGPRVDDGRSGDSTSGQTPSEPEASDNRPSDSMELGGEPSSLEPLEASLDEPTATPDQSWPPENELAAAVGVRRARKKNDTASGEPLLGPRAKRNLILGAVGAALIATFVIASLLNGRGFYIACGTDTVLAERGRFFPWGRAEFSGDKWRAVEIHSECASQEFATQLELEGAFLDRVMSRADRILALDGPVDVERASELLEQASLLARHPSRGGVRDEIARLGNDVEVRRASAEVDAALAGIESAKQRLSEMDGETRHASGVSDRAEFLARLLEIARSGVAPAGQQGQQPRTSSAPLSAPGAPGPAADNKDVSEPSNAEPGPPLGSEPAAPIAEPPVPTGGVLL